MKNILTLDGGGVKGLCEAEFCRLMWDQWPTFDLYAGTSTGGMIALALAQERTPQEIVDFYIAMSRNIFPHRRLRSLLVPFWPQRYSAKKLEKVIRDFYGYTLLKEAKIPIIICSHDMARGSAYFFREDKPYTFFDAARATSAAPTYFRPYRKGDHIFVDGGLYMNNPIMAAYVRARQLWPNEDLNFISIGSGIDDTKYEKIPKTTAQWLGRIIKIGMWGSEDVNHFYAETIANNTPHITYRRYDFEYPIKIKMDDSRDTTLELLLATAREEAEKWVT